MNERIKQLAEQATTRVDAVLNESMAYTYFDTEKFAQLIVRECISMADKESERYSNLDQEYCSMAMDNYRELVRKHFGVEE
jgi:hypothetical protein